MMPDKAFQVVSGDFVTTEDGTGVVHSSPTFGATDDFSGGQATRHTSIDIAR